MFLIRDIYKEFGWWFWLFTVPFLILHVTGLWDLAIYVAILLTAVQFAYYLYRDKNLLSFPVQVRVSYILLLISGLFPPLFFIHWLQVLGTSAVVLAGYCPLARTLSLLPLNRSVPLSWAYVTRAFFSRPVPGSILTSMPKATA